MNRAELADQLSKLAEEARVACPGAACTLFALAGAVCIERENDIAHAVVDVSMQHLSLIQESQKANNWPEVLEVSK